MNFAIVDDDEAICYFKDIRVKSAAFMRCVRLSCLALFFILEG